MDCQTNNGHEGDKAKEQTNPIWQEQSQKSLPGPFHLTWKIHEHTHKTIRFNLAQVSCIYHYYGAVCSLRKRGSSLAALHRGQPAGASRSVLRSVAPAMLSFMLNSSWFFTIVISVAPGCHQETPAPLPQDRIPPSQSSNVIQTSLDKVRTGLFLGVKCLLKWSWFGYLVTTCTHLDLCNTSHHPIRPCRAHPEPRTLSDTGRSTPWLMKAAARYECTNPKTTGQMSRPSLFSSVISRHHLMGGEGFVFEDLPMRFAAFFLLSRVEQKFLMWSTVEETKVLSFKVQELGGCLGFSKAFQVSFNGF